MTTDHAPAIVIDHPGEIAAAAGYLLGYQPTPPAICAIAVRGEQVTFGACLNLRALHSTSIEQAVADLADSLAANALTYTILLGYGPGTEIGHALATATAALAERGIVVRHRLRIDGGRCYCMCGDGCLPADGAPVPIAGRASAAAIYAGLVSQPDRASLANLYAPYTGEPRKAMEQAVERAHARLLELAFDDNQQLRADADAILLAHGVPAVDAAFALAASGQPLPDDDAAWLLMLLAYLPVRDHAWKQITTSDSHHDLLRSLMQRAPDELAAPPACLLAFWALLAGRGPIANIALERARTADPAYTLTRLLSAAMRAAMPPDQLHDLFTRAMAEDKDTR